MNNTKLHEEMTRQLHERTLLDQARQYADVYFEHVTDMRAVPSDEEKLSLRLLDEPLPAESQDAGETLALLQRAGNSTISAQGGGRYFGFVNGGILPVSLAARWLGDAWDQNAALYVMSPLTATLEHLCERWLVDLLGLPARRSSPAAAGSPSRCSVSWPS